MNKNKSEWGQHLAFKAFEVLRDNDGHMSVTDMFDEVKDKVNIPNELLETYETNTNYPIWIILVKFFTVKCVKTGLLEKREGSWYMSEEGLKLVEKGEKVFVQKVKKLYQEWLNQRNEEREREIQSSRLLDERIVDTDSDAPLNTEEVISDHVESQDEFALNEIQNHLRNMHFMDFQKLCGALLRGMGYYVHQDSKEGRDGGVDVWAYSDPLGKPPSIKLQAKRFNEGKVSLKVLNDLRLNLAEGDIGIIVTSSTFDKGCKEAAQKERGKHIELIDSARFLELWKKYYSNLSQDDRDKLPLRPVYFLDKARIKKS